MANHKQQGVGREARLQQHELAVAGDDEILDLLVAVAGLQPLAHQQAEILGERRVGIVDRLVLADETAQAFGDVPGPRLERRVWQHLVGLDGLGRKRGEATIATDSAPEREGRGDASGVEGVRHLLRRRRGLGRRPSRASAHRPAGAGPTATSAPPMNITTAPSQMNRTSGLK